MITGITGGIFKTVSRANPVDIVCGNLQMALVRDSNSSVELLEEHLYFIVNYGEL